MNWRKMMMMEEEGWRKGPWTAEEDRLLTEYVRIHGEGRWNSVARLAGLKRNGKSCRLRWVNYLRPDLKRGHITPHEESIILELHARWGNRWSTIARSLPGRTDNEIKNYWRTHFKKKAKVPCQGNEKSNNRFLRKQQFQQQQELLQQQLQLQQQQQEEPQLNQIDHIRRIMALLDETDPKITSINDSPDPQISSNSSDIVVTPEAAAFSEDQLLLDELLWDLKGFEGDFTPNCAFGKANLHNLVIPFC